MAALNPAPLDPEDAACASWGGGWYSRWWLLVPLLFLGVLVTAAVLSAWLGGGPPFPVSSGAAPWFWPVFPLGFFLLFVLIFGGLRWTVWGYGGGYRWRDLGGVSAVEILRRRFARGEISAEQFRQMSRELGDGR